jgi:predicted dithiol-disulfide oxidoreductase (DUF899 family)
VAISRAPLAEIARFRQRMGWRFKWVSSFGSDFNYEFKVSFTPEEVAKGGIYYNYGTWPYAYEEWPGISAFYKNDAGEVFPPVAGREGAHRRPRSLHPRFPA